MRKNVAYREARIIQQYWQANVATHSQQARVVVSPRLSRILQKCRTRGKPRSGRSLPKQQ